MKISLVVFGCLLLSAAVQSTTTTTATSTTASSTTATSTTATSTTATSTTATSTTATSTTRTSTTGSSTTGSSTTGSSTTATMTSPTTTGSSTTATVTTVATTATSTPPTSTTMTSTSATSTSATSTTGTTRSTQTTATTTPAPTTVPTGTFSAFNVGELTTVRSAANTLTISFTPSFTLPVGEQVTVSGLTGTQTPSTSTLALGGTNAANFASSVGVWNQASGALLLTVSTSLTASSAATFTISLINPIAQQTSPLIQLAASGTQPMSATGANFGVLTASTTAAGTFSPAPIISEITQVQGASNPITVTIQPSSPVPAGGVITIAGLTGSGTPNTASLPLSGGAGASLFSGSAGVWTQSTGTLVLTLTSILPSTSATSFTFTLINPTSTQAPVIPTVAITGAQAITQASFTGAGVLSGSSSNPCATNNGGCIGTCSLNLGVAQCSPCPTGYAGDGKLVSAGGQGCVTQFSFSVAGTPQTFNSTAFQCNVAALINANGGGPVQCSDIILQGQPIFS